jgi:hypothetical protein
MVENKNILIDSITSKLKETPEFPNKIKPQSKWYNAVEQFNEILKNIKTSVTTEDAPILPVLLSHPHVLAVYDTGSSTLAKLDFVEECRNSEKIAQKHNDLKKNIWTSICGRAGMLR